MSSGGEPTDPTGFGASFQQQPDVDLPACTSAFDALWFCFSPVNQMKHYHRDGNYDDCDRHQRMFELCMRLRWKTVNGKDATPEALAVREEMFSLSTKNTNNHVWVFKDDPAGPPPPAAVAEAPQPAKASYWWGGKAASKDA
ncbi:hypothetical protein T484DRAFT_1941420 [Baffinella frigidus]|nr:hypothetical protein T484DRAFT_1941420 [Cryptophyta sp. CCMP2293]|mmetsp:Transcript_44624/g.101691  ORF Transcript_44624/g.101691 Transcript_44624/m.101691 type:complete len:142 (-) Transcript_44624:121-546(-)